MLPHDLPAKSTVYDHFARWKADGTWQKILDALRQQVRVAEGRDHDPSAGSIDSQTVKATEIADSRDYERYTDSGETIIKACSIQRLLILFKQYPLKKAAPFKYREF